MVKLAEWAQMNSDIDSNWPLARRDWAAGGLAAFPN
jgi:hypothetical protein